MWSALSTVVANATFVDWLLFCVAVLLFYWIWGTWSYDFFRKRGIASTRPWIPFVGNSVPAFLGWKSLRDFVLDYYNDGKGCSVYGIFEFTTPMYVVRDPELIKIVAVKNFDNFLNHRGLSNEDSDPLFGKNLFSLRDQRWKDMRSTLSPAFTSSKIKGMFPLISQCCQQMVDHLRERYDANKGSTNQPLEVEMKNLFTRMANDVIATVAFGVSCDSLKNPENEFYLMGNDLVAFHLSKMIVFLLYGAVPKVAQLLKLRVLSEKSADYFDSLVRETVIERMKRGIFRPDMLQLLMQARQGKLKAEAGDEHEEDKLSKSTLNLTEEDVSAQAIIFFIAGFDTVSSGMSFTSYVLSRHPDVQRRLREEVDKVWERTGGKPSYEDVQGMKYLDAVVNETLRMYPPVVALERQCSEDTVLPSAQKSGPTPVRKGDVLWLPVIGLHYDSEYWPNPERLDPDRFSDDNKHNIKPFSYIPFGGGPRLCIGQRLALIELKLAIVYLVANFELSISPKMTHPLQYDKGFNLKVRGGIWSLLTPRNV